MARLEHLGGDRWKIYVDTGPPKARVRRTRRFRGPPPTASGKAPRVVQTAARKIEVELTQQRFHLAPERVTFRQATEAWWEWWMVARKHEKRTEVEYRRLLDQRLIPDLGGERVDRLSAGGLTNYYAQTRAAGLGATSVRRLHGLVRQVLKYAVGQHWAVRNVAVDAQLPSGRTKPMEIPMMLEVLDLVDAALLQSPLAARAVTVAFGLGLRRGELAGMRWSRVKWDEGVVVVDTSVMDARGEHGEKDTKTHQARRVPMKPWVVAALRKQQDAQRAAMGDYVTPDRDPFVWSRSITGGDAPDPDYFTQAFARAEQSRCCWEVACPVEDCGAGPGQPCVRSGKERWHRPRRKAAPTRFRLHDLRHAFASYMLSEGVPLQEVSRLLGHRSTQVTASVYSHADPTGEGARAAIDRLPDIPARVEIVERRALPVLRRPVELGRPEEAG